jgi:lactate dehydrogenase-like 2-hydroxyacid dehydrogenase
VIATSHHAVVDAALMRRLPKLEIIASFGVGYDHIDAAWAAQHGIIVTHTPGVLDDEVADIAMALTLATTRQLPQAERYLREGKWLGGAYRLTASLRERTMGIVGLGRIGKAIAGRAAAFGLDVVYHGRSQQIGAPYLYYPTLIGMAKACDILMVAAPGGAGTRHIVDKDVIEAVGPDGIIVNVSRGSVIDEAALIAALQRGKLLGAGLDVFETEPKVPPALLKMKNVMLTPHLGSAVMEVRDLMANTVVDNIQALIDGRMPPNCVNPQVLPQVLKPS